MTMLKELLKINLRKLILAPAIPRKENTVKACFRAKKRVEVG